MMKIGPMDEWKWSNRGVSIEGDGLLWYEESGATASASGAGRPQTFDEFLQRGSPVEGVPPEIINEVTQAVRKRLRDHNEPSAEANNPGDGPDFDHLARTAHAPDASIDDKNALYAAAFRLKEWFFIARGKLPDIQPYCAVNLSLAGGALMLKAFTDTGRLHEFVKENDLAEPDGNLHIITMPVSILLPTMASYASQGVRQIHFNANQASDGFYCPLTQLPAIRQHLQNSGFL